MVVLGFSSSPITDGNVERMVKAILEKSGKDSEFINLTALSYGPCRTYVHLCASDNLCKIDDDLRQFYPKTMNAEALVLGSPSYFNNLNSFIGGFLKRLWAFRHRRFPLQGKPYVVVSTGGSDQPENAIEAVKKRMSVYKAKCIGSVSYLSQIFPCYKCGYGHTCKVGSFYKIHGTEGARAR